MGLKGVAQKGKGKAVAETQSCGDKRKIQSDGKGKSSGGRRRTDRGVLKFFDDVAEDADGSDESDFGEDDFMDDAAEPGPKVTVEPGKSFDIPFVPKEEVMDEVEFDKMMEERYKNGSTFVTYAEDYEEKSFRDRGFVMPTEKDPVIWKVKCAVGREKYLTFCLMQKFVDLKSIGTKLHIISAFTVEHVKGFIFMEADKQSDLNLACNGIGGVFASRVMAVPRDEVSRLFSIRSEYNEVTVGMWARVKNGIYKGDLGQVVAVNKSRKRATVKLIPRIDLLALTEKFGEGRTSTKRTSTPAPRLISASELEEFRPLIQSRQDRDTGKVFEVLDGMMIKDGFIFKKIAIDSLSFWGVVPSEEELLKFKTTENHGSDDREWLSQLYGEEKKTNLTGSVVMPEKGESSSGSNAKNGFEVHDLVCFGRKDFGVIIGMEKDETYKILKEGAEGPVVVNVQRREIKSGPSNMKFTASDHRMKAICVSDTVKVTEGPNEGKQGVVKLIYRGTIFLYDGNEEVNGGYFCCQSRICEKIKPSFGSSKEKGEESDPVTFEEFPPSPKSPLSPEKSFQVRESREFKQGDEGNIYSIGQLLRIRVGPLKGYLCRVLAIYRSDVTVKLDSKHKVITVKSEHLSEVQKKNPIISSDEPESSSFKPSDLLGSEGGSRGWMDGAGTSAPNDGWNTGGLSSERSSWGDSSANPSSPKGEANTDAEDGWGSKVPPKKNNVSWGPQGAENNQAGDSAGKSSGGSWGLKTGGSDSWDKVIDVSGDPKGSSGNAEKTWGNDENQDGVKQSEDSWGKGTNNTSNAGGSWGDAATGKNKDDPWGKGKSVVEGGWEKKGDFGSSDDGSKPPQKSWDMGNQKPSSDMSSWGNASQSQDAGGWGQKSAGNSGPGGFGGNQDSVWGKQANKSESTGGNQDSAWGKKSSDENQASAWGKKSSDENQASAWSQKSSGGNQESAWGKKSSHENQASGWGKKSSDENQASAWGKKSSDENQASAWGKNSSDENQASTWGKKSSDENQDSAWGQKSNSGNQDSAWGNKSNQNSERGGINGNEDSAWGKKSNPNSEAGGNGGNQSSWGGKSNWNSEPGGSGVNQGSGWGNKSCGSGNEEQNSNWGGKSDWSSGSGFKGNQSFNSGNDDQTDGGGGNWRGGRGSFRGRGGDRGGFGGRGGDRGGFGGRGDRGGFGGRGGDRGGFGGRGGDRGGFGGRGRSDSGDFGGRGGGFGGRGGDKGGFGGRGGSDRGGGFGGRGRGRRDDSGGGGGWNSRDSGGNGSWRSNSGEENRNVGGGGGGGGWSQGGGGFKKEWQGGGSSGDSETRNSAGGIGWRQQSDGGNGGGWNSGQSSGGWKGSNMAEQGGSWGKGTSSSGCAAGGGWGNNNNNSKSPGGGDGWGSTNNNSESSGGGGGWGNNNNNSKSSEGGWGSMNNNSKSPGGGGGWGTTNNNSKSPASSGGWGSTKSDSKSTNGSGGSGSWDKGGASGSGGGSWGANKPSGGGWNTDGKNNGGW